MNIVVETKEGIRDIDIPIDVLSSTMTAAELNNYVQSFLIDFLIKNGTVRYEEKMNDFAQK
jgi:hypothetical protein